MPGNCKQVVKELLKWILRVEDTVCHLHSSSNFVFFGIGLMLYICMPTLLLAGYPCYHLRTEFLQQPILHSFPDQMR